MAHLSTDILYDIFSRIPIKSLACFRCVCKQWREYINDPHLANIHHHVKDEPRPLHHALIESSTTLFGHQERKRSKSSNPFQPDVSVLSFLGVTEDTIHGIQVKKDPSSIFQVKRSSILYQPYLTMIQGYCNGLITLAAQGLSSDQSTTTYVVINPLTKECHQLPPMKKLYIISGQGLGFDHSTNTFKMVCNVYDAKQNLTLTLVHVLGTDSWRQIPQLPLHRIFGAAVYANGRLYWFVLTSGWSIIGSGRIVWFDINKEEFGVIVPPKQTEGLFCLGLVDINGELGCLSYSDEEVEVCILMKHEDQWFIHCVFKNPAYSYGRLRVLGCWNLDGDLLLRSSSVRFQLYVYRLKSDSFHKLIGPEDEACEEGKVEVRMYQSSLLSIRKWH